MGGVLGLDIGGANVKTAHADGTARTWPFALWKQGDGLATKLAEIRRAMPEHDTLAVTMTGELCDCYSNRREGVRRILGAVAEAAGGAVVKVWSTRGCFLGPEAAREQPLAVASANWLALAWLAYGFTEGRPAVLIDVGSTTTDVVYLGPRGPEPRGLIDAARLERSELVYTGLRRTPVCAVLGMDVAAEFFATMLDVYVVLGLVPEAPEDRETADGRPATVANARARLARMWCADAGDFTPERLQELAGVARDAQVRRLVAAVERVVADREAPRIVVLAGSGEVVARSVADRAPSLAAVGRVSLVERLGAARSEAACAWAVARMASEAAPWLPAPS